MVMVGGTRYPGGARMRAALTVSCVVVCLLQGGAAFQFSPGLARLAAQPAGAGRRTQPSGAARVARGGVELQMMEIPPPPPLGDADEDEPGPKQRVNWGDRFKRALEMNPGRSERLSRTEQEERYKQVLTANPKDVDALCGYACFLSTVKEDYVGASELYSTAVRTDPARARRITVQLWADLWAMRVENARVTKAKDEWRKLLEKADKEGRGTVEIADARAIFTSRGLSVPEEAIAQAARGTSKIYYLELAESLSNTPPPSLGKNILASILGR